MNTGQYLVECILSGRYPLKLAFVWNRTTDVLKDKVDEKYILTNLDDFSNR